MTPRGETRKRVLRTAGDLFQRQGFHGTGLQQVLAESGAPKGSLYFHFPGGKEQLAAEAVAGSGAAIAAAIARLVEQADDTAGAVRALADLLAAGLEASGYERGCPIATVALDAAAESEPIRAACDAGFERWLALLEQRLRDDGFEPADARGKAVLILAALEGGLVLSRTRHDTEPLRLVVAELEGGLRR